MTTILLLKRNWLIYGLISHNMHLAISPLQKHHPFFAKPPLKSASCPSPPFLENPPYLSFFLMNQRLKSDFSVNPHKKLHPHLPQQPPSKNCDHVKPPPPLFLENQVGDLTTQQKWRGSHCFPDIQYLFGASKISYFWASTASY